MTGAMRARSADAAKLLTAADMRNVRAFMSRQAERGQEDLIVLVYRGQHVHGPTPDPIYTISSVYSGNMVLDTD